MAGSLVPRLILPAAILTVGLGTAWAQQDAVPSRIAEAVIDKDGCRVHEIESPLQGGRTEVRVLLPDRVEAGNRYPAVYVLPVEAGREHRFGDGLAEVKRLGLHNRYGAIFAAPTFSHLPWYADHPTDPGIRQETYFLTVVVPLVEKRYPVRAEPAGRLLLGFSKSGVGAYTLLLRHPELFGKAAAWDAPLMKDKPDQFGMDGIYGTQENFGEHRISSLFARRAAELRGEPRLILTGYGNFRQHHQDAHRLMDRLGIPHAYRDGPPRKHDWHSGWVAEAVELMFERSGISKDPSRR